MYEVIKKDSGQRIAICEQPRYVLRNELSGAFIQCDREDAEGVAVGGEVYSLNNQLDGKPEAMINEIDGGVVVFDHDSDLAGMHGDLLDIQTALCELDLA